MSKQRRTAAVGTVLALLFALLLPAVVSPGAGASAIPLDVLVAGPTGAAAAAAVEEAGGTVDLRLDVIDAVAARLTPDVARRLAARRDLQVLSDTPARVASGSFDAVQHDVQIDALNPGADWSPEAGAGVGVALIDTGVAATPDLDGRLVRGPDLSGDDDGVDHHGHGTFMAGLIAGDGSASAAGPVRHVGVAPGAHLVTVKVAGRDGSTSLSRVIGGIEWALDHRVQLGIRVLSLSLAAAPIGAWQADPLSMAVEAAWSEGVAVVVAAGNEEDEVASPGRHPAVITVGASETHGTATRGDDTRASWSGQESYGGDRVKPELVAPGVSVVSLRAPGSAIDQAHPGARVEGSYFRGSGTSMSTALAAGATAVLAARHPDAGPSDLKAALVAGADQLPGSFGGALDLDGAEAAGAEATGSPGGGSGRGLGRRVEVTGSRWAGSRWAGSRWADDEWAGSRWAGSRWAGSRWADDEWAGSRWAGSRWAGSRWAGSRWAGSRWAGSRWAAAGWDVRTQER